MINLSSLSRWNSLIETIIERWDPVVDPDSPDWRVSAGKSPAVPIEINGFGDFLEEKHHRLYGRPWSIGRGYFDYLVEVGLKPRDRVLDFGCGAGRVGIWLIGSLDRACYFGVDSHFRSLEAFAHYEIPLHGLSGKEPRLVHDRDFQLSRFNSAFDYVLDFYVSSHLLPDRILMLYSRFVGVLSETGRIVLAHPPKLHPDELHGLGLEIERTDIRASFLLDKANPKYVKTDNMHVLRRADHGSA